MGKTRGPPRPSQFNELDLSAAQPALDFFLPCNRLSDVLELLEVD
jgi:hypothetical protein